MSGSFLINQSPDQPITAAKLLLRELFHIFRCLTNQRHKKQADEHRQEEVMKTWLLLFAFLLVGIPSVSSAAVGDAVEVSIVTDNGHLLPFYPHKSPTA